MNYSKFSIRIPKALRDLLEDEALIESRSLNNQITIILNKHYKTHSPPVASIRSSKSHNGHKVNRKTKAEVN